MTSDLCTWYLMEVESLGCGRELFLAEWPHIAVNILVTIPRSSAGKLFSVSYY